LQRTLHSATIRNHRQKYLASQQLTARWIWEAACVENGILAGRTENRFDLPDPKTFRTAPENLAPQQSEDRL